jgi:hypothetical protein
LLAHGEMVHRASRKPFSIAIFSNARWRGEFREGVNRDGARLFQHSMSATAQMAPHCTTVRRTPSSNAESSARPFGLEAQICDLERDELAAAQAPQGKVRQVRPVSGAMVVGPARGSASRTSLGSEFH